MWAVRGRQKDEWSRWAQWMAMFAESKRDKKRRRKPFDGDEFNPFTARPRDDVIIRSKDLTPLKAIFIGL